MAFQLATEKHPSKPGTYHVVFEGVMSFIPIFKDWDGEKWIKVPCMYGTIDDMSWSEPNDE